MTQQELDGHVQTAVENLGRLGAQNYVVVLVADGCIATGGCEEMGELVERLHEATTDYIFTDPAADPGLPDDPEDGRW